MASEDLLSDFIPSMRPSKTYKVLCNDREIKMLRDGGEGDFTEQSQPWQSCFVILAVKNKILTNLSPLAEALV